MGSKNTGKYALAIVALIVGAFIFTGGNLGSLAPGSLSTSTTTFPTTTTTTSTGTGLTKGEPVSISLSHRDAGSQAALTEATNVKTTAVYPNGLGGYTIGPATSNSAITYYMQDNSGKAWLSFETQASGQAYAFDPKKTAAANPGIIGECTYTDIELDGTQEFLCPVSTEGLRSQMDLSGTTPTLGLTPQWNNIAWFTLSSPSDQSSIGTTAGTAKYTQYTFTGTAGDSVYLSKITLQNNSTNTAKWSEADMYIKMKDAPGYQWSLSQGTFTDKDGQQYTVTRTQDGTNTIYEIFYGYKLGGAKKIDLPNSGSGIIGVEIKNVWNLSSGNVITQTLKLDGVTEVDGAQTQRTDAVNNSA